MTGDRRRAAIRDLRQVTIRDRRQIMAKVRTTMTSKGRLPVTTRGRRLRIHPTTNRDIMTKLRTALLIASVAGVISGCGTPPMGHTVPVMPGPNKSLEAFQQDEATCQDYAGQRTAGGAEAANNTAIGEGIV